jgi:hypothetical protein
MDNEIPTTALETQVSSTPTCASVQTVPAAPPATKLVVEGLKSEREIQLEAQLDAEKAARRTAETISAEKEREVQRLKEIPSVPVKKVKRFWLPSPVIGSDEEEEE